MAQHTLWIANKCTFFRRLNVCCLEDGISQLILYSKNFLTNWSSETEKFSVLRRLSASSEKADILICKFDRNLYKQYYNTGCHTAKTRPAYESANMVTHFRIETLIFYQSTSHQIQIIFIFKTVRLSLTSDCSVFQASVWAQHRNNPLWGPSPLPTSSIKFDLFLLMVRLLQPLDSVTLDQKVLLWVSSCLIGKGILCTGTPKVLHAGMAFISSNILQWHDQYNMQWISGVPKSTGAHIGCIMGMYDYSLDNNKNSFNLHFGETHKHRKVHK